MLAMATRKEFFLVALWSVFIALIWTGPALWGYAMHIADHDTAMYYYPILDFYAKALQSGQSFLWIPGMFSGFPVYVSQTGGFFDPLNILIYSFFDGFQGTHIRLFIDFVATCTLSYLAARSFGISRIASALVGPSFLIAFHLRYLSNPVIANTLFVVPLLIYAANGLLVGSMRRGVVVSMVALGVGITFLSGYTQIVVYALLTTAIYVMIRIALFRLDWTLVSLSKKGVTYGVGILIGVCIGLPFIVPASIFLPLTARAEPPTYEQSTLKVTEYGDLALFAVPDHFYIPYITPGKKPLFVGAIWFFLALATIVFSIRLLLDKLKSVSRSEAEIIAISLTALIVLVLSVRYSPLYYVVAKLPVLGQFRFPYRFMFVGAFLFALLGAIGFDRIKIFIEDRIVRYVLEGWASICALMVAGIVSINMIGVSGGVLLASVMQNLAVRSGVYGLLGMEKGDAHYADALLRALEAVRELLSLKDMAILLPLLTLFFAVCLVTGYVFQILKEEYFKKGVIALTVFTVIVIPVLRYRSYVPVSEAGTAPHMALSFAAPEDLTLYRMYSFVPWAAVGAAIPPQFKLSSEEEKAVTQHSVLGGVPNYFLYHTLGSVDGYDQFVTLDTLAAIEQIGGELFAGYGAGTVEERTENLLNHLDVLSMMGGKYIISGVELTHPRLQLLSRQMYTTLNIPLFLYENEAFPKFYFAKGVISQPHASFRELTSNSVSFEKDTYLDCDTCSEVARNTTVLPLRIENGFYELSASTTNPGYLVLSESYIKGWRAYIDGESVDITRANGLYMAVKVPEGQHTIRFEFGGLLNELRILQKLLLVDERE